jgi:hypothetical protein
MVQGQQYGVVRIIYLLLTWRRNNYLCLSLELSMCVLNYLYLMSELSMCVCVELYMLEFRTIFCVELSLFLVLRLLVCYFGHFNSNVTLYGLWPTNIFYIYDFHRI